ncbi:HARB1-like protein, partial [Mya arenaria]
STSKIQFSNDNIDRLVDLLTDRLRRSTQRNHSLTVRQQVMIALRFYSSGAFLQVIGDTFSVDIATVSRPVTDVTNALFDLRDRAIKFLTEAADLQAAKSAFYARKNFPSVFRCINETHIHIQSRCAESQASVHVGQGHVMMPMCGGPPVYANTWKRITKGMPVRKDSSRLTSKPETSLTEFLEYGKGSFMFYTERYIKKLYA